jgi:WD40 repeat protein
MKLKVENLIGNTAHSYLAAIDSLIIYQAGATIILHDIIANTKEYIQPGTKQIQSLDIYKNLIAIGEICHQPKLHIYNIQAQTITNSFSGHKYAINFTKFTPDGLHIITIGNQNDATIIIWDLKTGTKTASIKTSFKITDFKIDPDSKYFVTIGHKHIKFWNLKFNQTITGLSGLLGDLKDESLISVGIQNHFIYSITASGLLLMFNGTYGLEKWLDAKMIGTAIITSKKNIIVGGNDGKIRFFEPVTLKHLKNAPVNKLDVVSMMVNDTKLVVLYSGNLIVFDLEFNVLFDVQQHRECVWGVNEIDDGFCSFSLDGTVKFWDKVGGLKSVLEGEPRRKDGEQGLRSFAISPLNNIIACGDRLGTIR